MDLFKAFHAISSWGSCEGHPADLFDRLTYRITSFIIMILVAIIGLKSYVFKPIQCTLTESYTSAPVGFEEYAENMCWIENVFRLARTDSKSMYGDPDSTYKSLDYDLRSKIRLYQWTPIVLAIQAFCCYIPYIFWTAMQQRAGINLTSIVSAVIKANCSLDPDERNKQTEFAARSVDECLLMQREYRSGCTFEFRNCLTRILPCLPGKRSGNLLTMGYLLLKVLFVALPIAQIWFMSRYIGVSSMFFGLEIFINCTLNINGTCDHLGDGHWASTGIFPLRAGCLVPVQWRDGKSIYWDCALPINFILEKVYVFLWGWFVFIFVLNVYSLLFWIYKLFVPGKRNHFVNKFLRLLSAPDYANKEARHSFIDKYIRLDGVLTLRLVSDIAGDMAAARILLSMWKRYLTSWNHWSCSTKSPRGSGSGNGSTNVELNLNHIRGGSKPSGTTPSIDRSPKTSSGGAHAALLMNTDQITGYSQS